MALLCPFCVQVDEAREEISDAATASDGTWGDGLP